MGLFVNLPIKHFIRTEPMKNGYSGTSYPHPIFIRFYQPLRNQWRHLSLRIIFISVSKVWKHHKSICWGFLYTLWFFTIGITYGRHSHRYEGVVIWENLPNNVKLMESLIKFKEAVSKLELKECDCTTVNCVKCGCQVPW